MNLEGEDSKKKLRHLQCLSKSTKREDFRCFIFSFFLVTLYLMYLSAAQKPTLPKTTTKKNRKNKNK